MNTNRLMSRTAVTGALLVAFSLTSAAFAGSKPDMEISPVRMNYALEGEAVAYPAFDAIDLEEPHEMNDAWMAMPVEDVNGKTIGVVEDAYVGDDGDIESVLVTLNSTGRQILVDGEIIYLTDAAAVVELDSRAIALAMANPRSSPRQTR